MGSFPSFFLCVIISFSFVPGFYFGLDFCVCKRIVLVLIKDRKLAKV